MTKSRRILLAIVLGAATLIAGLAFTSPTETSETNAIDGGTASSSGPGPLSLSKLEIAGLSGFKTGYTGDYDVGLRQVLFKPVERSSLIRFAFALLRTRLAGSALLGVAMLLGLAITVFGISVYIKGDLADTLADNKPYRVYDSTINLNGEIDHPWQTRNAAFWLIFESVKNKNGCADGHYLLALRDSWNASSPDYVDFSKDKNFTTLNDASYRLQGIYTYVYRECPSWGDGGITWLEWGWTSYWLNNPNYNLKVGPAGSLVQRSGDMTKDFPGAPQKVSWVKGNTYTVRLVGSLESGFGQQDSTQHDDRQIIYKGLPDVNDTSDLDNQVGNTLTIKLAPADPDDYSLVNCKSTIKNYKSTYIAPDGSKGGPKDTVVLTGGPDQAGGYLASLTLDSKVYHKGDTFDIVTECDFQPKPGVLGIGGHKGGAKHHIEVKEDGTFGGKLWNIFHYHPVPIYLHGYFLEDDPKRVRVEGTIAGLDSSISHDEIKIEASFDGQKTWQSPISNPEWGDSWRFSCDFRTDIPSDRAISVDVRASIEGIIGAVTQVVNAQFDLNSFVEAHFLNPKTRTPIYVETGLVSFDAQSIREDPTADIRKVGNKIEFTLTAVVTVNHAIDNLGFHLTLADSMEKAPGQNWAPNWKSPGGVNIWTPNNAWDGGSSDDSSLLVKTGGALQPGDYRFNVRLLIDTQNFQSGHNVTLTIDASQSKAVKLEDPDAKKPMITRTLSFALF